MPYRSVHDMLRLRILWGTSANSKTLFIYSGTISLLTLNILVISFCRFCWCNVVELSVISSSSKDQSKCLCTIRKTVSWSLLMHAFSCWLWKIHTTWQYEKWQITKEFIISILCSEFIDDVSLGRALLFRLAFLHRREMASHALFWKLNPQLVSCCGLNFLVEIQFQESIGEKNSWTFQLWTKCFF